MYIIASYRSRDSSIKLCEVLKNHGVTASIVNTPREAYIGCGLSVRFEENNFAQVKYIVMQQNLSAFAGYFSVSDAGRKEVKLIG